MVRSKQTTLFSRGQSAYGGILLNTRKGRAQGRPLSVKQTMHLVLRSSHAVKEKSFLKNGTANKIQIILKKFATKYGVRILSVANVGNHLHIHLKLTSRPTYAPFIRAVTAAIAMAATGSSRWSKLADQGIKKFWDYRPFTKVIQSRRYFLNINDYLLINQLEGLGYKRIHARALISVQSTG